MSSREDILKRIRDRKPAATPLPTVPTFPRPDIDPRTHFRTVLEGVGGQLFSLSQDRELPDLVRRTYPKAAQVASVHPAIASDLDLATITDPHALAAVDLAILTGHFAVAENAAIWLDDTVLPHRALPFITQHLLLTVPADQLYWNLHEAYAQLEVQATGFGLFLSGPSKTADIEQSLVIGAHGARSLSVVLIG